VFKLTHILRKTHPQQLGNGVDTVISKFERWKRKTYRFFQHCNIAPVCSLTTLAVVVARIRVRSGPLKVNAVVHFGNGVVWGEIVFYRRVNLNRLSVRHVFNGGLLRSILAGKL